MKTSMLRFTLLLSMFLAVPLTGTAQVVDIPDPNLRVAIETALGKASGDTITEAEMATLTELDATGIGIGNLTGLERATNLTELELDLNAITDISPLAGLINLQSLDLTLNGIEDISALTGLTNLERLGVGFNMIADISPLATLTKLEWLGLWDNNITDISALTGLTNLEGLGLSGNVITDVSPLVGLTSLIELYVGGNKISDITPLVANTGLGAGDTVDVSGNPLSDLSMNTHIPALESRGVAVWWGVYILDPNLRIEIEEALGKAADAPITVADMATLTELDAATANIYYLTGLEYATNLIGLDLQENHIKELSPLTSLTNLEGLGLSGNPITDISPLAKLTKLEWLWLYDNALTDITALAGLTNLTSLELGLNSITDISALAGLTNLEGLGLFQNNITDLSPLVANTGLGSGDEIYVLGNPLSDLSIKTHIPTLQNRGATVEFDAPEKIVDIPDPNLRAVVEHALGKAAGASITVADMATLTRLDAMNHKIGNLTGLEGATNLTFLQLRGNPITDIAPLVGLTNLEYLNLWETGIVDISALAGLTNLTSLMLGFNDIEDISPIAGLTNLTSLQLPRNSITDISPLAALTHLRSLYLDGNQITDILPLVANTGLGAGDRVEVGGNPLSDLSINTHIPVLQSRGVTVGFDASQDIVDQPADVNGDGEVDIIDLVLVAANYGQTGENDADVNGDGVVNVEDLIAVATVLDRAPAAPVGQPQTERQITPAGVQRWLSLAQGVNLTDARLQKGILFLEQLLVSLLPKETSLLSNYPNPFNPETWMPYRLAADAWVQLTIYDQTGQVVRTIDIGHQVAGAYERRSRAIYWDGRNHLGEQVASGVYFYHLDAGDYSQTRKMLILK